VVECHLAKVDVEGSNPFSRSAFSSPSMALAPLSHRFSHRRAAVH
jgi:hypothetical protein